MGMLFPAIGHGAWPPDSRLRLEWQIPRDDGRKAGDDFFVRVQDFDRFSMIDPEGSTHALFDDRAETAEWIVWAPEGGEPQLWFRAKGDRRYYSNWGAFSSDTDPADSHPSKRYGEESPAQSDLTNPAHPPGWNDTIPVLEATPGLLQTPASDLPAGGLFRVVNTGAGDNQYMFMVRIHRSPWRKRNLKFEGGLVRPGRATPWARLPNIVQAAPATLQVYSGPKSVDKMTGRLELASAPSEDRVLRRLDMNGKVLTVECSSVNFRVSDQIRTDAEIGASTLARVEEMSFKGRRPERFPTGYAGGHEDQHRAGRLLGFTAALGSPGRPTKEFFERLGYRYIYTYTHWLGQWNRGGGGYRRDRNDEHARELGARWGRTGLTDRIYRISVRDEANLDAGGRTREKGLADMHKDPDAWSQVIGYAGLEPADFIRPDDPPAEDLDPMSPEYWRHLRGCRADEREEDPACVYNTMKVWRAVWPCRFGNIRASLRKAFGADILTTANVHERAYFRDNLSGIDPWMIYSKHQALDVPQVCDYEVGWPQHEEWLIDLQRCALRPHAHKPVEAMLQAQVSYFPRPPLHLKLCAMSAVGAGARSLSFYKWGPRYLATENWYDTDPERLQVIGDINHAVGWVEEILLHGSPPPARAAILYSGPGDLWDRLAPAEGIDRPSRYLKERRILYHLLRGLHRGVDMIHDEVLPADQGIDVDQYKIIFMSQRCITEKGAHMLLDWVRRGGTLIGIVSVGQLDELERPYAPMLEAFGLSSISVAFDSGREAREIPGAGIRLRDRHAMFARVEVSDAGVTARFKDGSPAVTEKRLGRGKLIYAAWGPGDAYHRFSDDTSERARKLRLLEGMQEEVRDLVAGWIEGAGPPICRTDHPLVSARLIESPKGAAVVLVNSTDRDPLPEVTVTIRGRPLRTAESLEQGPLRLSREGDTITFRLPLSSTDIVRLD